MAATEDIIRELEKLNTNLGKVLTEIRELNTNTEVIYKRLHTIGMTLDSIQINSM